MPTNFADLPINRPVPNGKVQITRGAENSNMGHGTADAAGIPLTTVGGTTNTPCQIQTPTAANMLYPCIWVIRANVNAVAYGGGGWRRWDWGIRITPADVDGKVVGCQIPIQLHESVNWRSSHGQCVFRLAAGVQYTAFLCHQTINLGAAAYSRDPLYLRIIGRMVMMGVL